MDVLGGTDGTGYRQKQGLAGAAEGVQETQELGYKTF